MPDTIEVNAKELEYVLTEALLAIQGVQIGEDEKSRVERSLQTFLQKIDTPMEIVGHKTPLDL